MTWWSWYLLIVVAMAAFFAGCWFGIRSERTWAAPRPLNPASVAALATRERNERNERNERGYREAERVARDAWRQWPVQPEE